MTSTRSKPRSRAVPRTSWIRITSYNVCYTKLLRLGPGTIRVAHTADERIRKDELRAGVAAYVRLASELLRRVG